MGGSTQQGYIPLRCSAPLWSDQEVINPLLASKMLYPQLEEHSNRKEGRNASVAQSLSHVGSHRGSLHCMSSEHGSGVTNYWRGSISHVNQMVENTYNNTTVSFRSDY